MSDTPRTDGVVMLSGNDARDIATIARAMERDLANARARITSLEAERDRAREALTGLADNPGYFETTARLAASRERNVELNQRIAELEAERDEKERLLQVGLSNGWVSVEVVRQSYTREQRLKTALEEIEKRSDWLTSGACRDIARAALMEAKS